MGEQKKPAVSSTGEDQIADGQIVNGSELSARDTGPGTRRLRMSVSRRFVDKMPLGIGAFVDDWENVKFTIDELIEHVRAGLAYCAELKGPRERMNFQASDLVSVDIDHGMSVDEALTNPLVANHAAFIYTTANHSTASPRFRIVFVLPQTIMRVPAIENVARALALRLCGDAAATDAARLFFGSSAGTVHRIDQTLGAQMLADLLTQGAAAKVRKEGSIRSGLFLATDELVRLADGSVHPLAGIDGKPACFCPYHADNNASAFVVRSQRGVAGVHCSTCRQTFWPMEVPEYDFTDFVEKAKATGDTRREGDESLRGVHVSIVNGRRPTPQILKPGLTFIRSEKGTGKTEALRRLASKGRVLVVGHRRLLSRQIASRLGIDSYLDRHLPPGYRKEKEATILPYFEGYEEKAEQTEYSGASRWKGNEDPRLNRFAVSIDSLEIVPVHKPYDIVVIDESEQVFAHFLADTIDDPRRNRLLTLLTHIVCNAKSVIALDADLGWITYNALSRMAVDEAGTILKPRHIWINEERPFAGRILEVHKSDRVLVGELFEEIRAGKRCFVTSSSRKRVQKLAASINANIPGCRTLLISSDNRGDAQDRFIARPADEFMNYDVVLASPSLGTGVDITFSAGREVVDSVYGFCDPLPLTHLDFDQQLSRVRHPKATKVWISPETSSFETAVDVARRDIVTAAKYKDIMIGWDSDGRPVFSENDPLIELAASVTAQRRASCNSIKKHFLEHKRRQGYKIVEVEHSEVQDNEGRAALALGTELDEERYAERLLAAKVVTEREYERIRTRMHNDQAVTESERWDVARTTLELFYREAASGQLIRKDDRGTYREVVRMFERTRVRLRNPTRPELDPLVGARPLVLRNNMSAAELMARLLRSTPLVVDGRIADDATFTKDDLAPLVEFCRRNRALIETQLRENVRADLATKPVQQLGRLLKRIGLRLEVVSSRRSQGIRTRRYRLRPADLSQLRAITGRRREIEGWQSIADRYWPAASDDLALGRSDDEDLWEREWLLNIEKS
jgi:hypothetical protein